MQGFFNKFSLQCCMHLARPKAEGQTRKQTKAQQVISLLLPVCSQSYLIRILCNFLGSFMKNYLLY